MPFKHHAARRHRIPKARYRVRNWPAYKEGLQRRGDLTLWVDEAAVAGWLDPRRRTPGRQPRLPGPALPVPAHTPLSRRARAFAGRQSRARTGNGPLHLVLDSTGLEL